MKCKPLYFTFIKLNRGLQGYTFFPILIQNIAPRRFLRGPTIYVLSKNKENIKKKDYTENFHFFRLKKNLVFVMVVP